MMHDSGREGRHGRHVYRAAHRDTVRMREIDLLLPLIVSLMQHIRLLMLR